MTTSVLMQRAHLLLEQNRYQQAEEQLRQVLLQEPDSADAHGLLAICLAMNKDRFEEATQEAHMAVHLAPDDDSSHRALAIVLSKRKQIPQALAAIEESLRLDPYFAFSHGLRASLLLQLERWEEALSSCDMGLSIDPDDETCGSLRVFALERLGRTQDALQEAERTTQRSPDSSDAHASRGWALLNRGQYRAAQEAFREALRLEPTNDWARRGMMDAINSNHWLFRVCFNAQIAISRWTQSKQWILILGAWLAMRVLGSLSDTYPALKPYVMPLTLLYVGFCILSWVLQPLFDTLLRFHPFGKYLLSRKETWASNAIATVFVVSAVAAGTYLYFASFKVALLIGITGLYLLLPVTISFKASNGLPRYAMIAGTTVLALMWLTTVALANTSLSGLALTILYGYLVGIFVSGIVGNILPRVHS